jgi:hypothetical protein
VMFSVHIPYEITRRHIPKDIPVISRISLPKYTVCTAVVRSLRQEKVCAKQITRA